MTSELLRNTVLSVERETQRWGGHVGVTVALRPEDMRKTDCRRRQVGLWER